MKKHILVFISLLLFQFSFSQNELNDNIKQLDSLEALLNTSKVKDSTKVNLLISVFLTKNRIYGVQDTIYHELLEAIEIAKEIKFEIGEARALIILADRYYFSSKIDSAFLFSLKAISIFEKYSNKADLIDGYSMLSTMYNQTKDYQKSLEMNLKSIALIKDVEPNISFSRLYFSTGKSFEGVKDYQNAILYYKKAKSISIKFNFLIGSVIADGAIGHIYILLKKYKEALPLILNTLEFSQKSGHNQAIAASHLELGIIYKELKRYKESIFHLESSIQVYKEMNNYKVLKNLYKDLAISYESIGEYPNATANLKLAVIYSDTIISLTKNEIVTELQTKYETEKIKKEMELAEANELISLEKANNSRNISIGAILFSGITILLLIVIFNRLKLIRKQKIKLDDAYLMLEESKKYELAESNLKALKSQMNPHFIFNSLNSIQDLILMNDTDKSYDYIVLFAELVRNTLTYSNNEFISFNKEIDFLSIYLKLEKLRFEEEFEYEIITNEIENIRVPSLIVQPFLENSLKHGLLHKDGLKKINLEFKLDKELTCIITDNGVGRTESARIQKRRGNKSHESFAMGAIKKRLDLLSDKFEENFNFEVEDLYEYDIAKGTKITVIIPFEEEF